MLNRRGGLLRDAFLLLLVIAGAAAFWFYAGPRLSRRPRAVSPAPNLGAVSVQWETETRGLLVEAGLKETHVVKAYNKERQEGPAQWVESVLELDPPPSFNQASFIEKWTKSAEARGLRVVREGSSDQWTVQDKGRVVQRLVFLSGPQGARPPPRPGVKK